MKRKHSQAARRARQRAARPRPAVDEVAESVEPTVTATEIREAAMWLDDLMVAVEQRFTAEPVVEPSAGPVVAALLDELDARVTVAGDAATEYLERALEALSPNVSIEPLLDAIRSASEEACRDRDDARERCERARVQLETWSAHAANHELGELAEQAADRAAEIKAALTAHEAEIAEYEATVEQLRASHALVVGRARER